MASEVLKLPRDLAEFLNAASELLNAADEVVGYVTTYSFGLRNSIELYDCHFDPSAISRMLNGVGQLDEKWDYKARYGGLDAEVVEEITAARRKFGKPFKPDMEFYSEHMALSRSYRSATEFLLIYVDEVRRALSDVEFNSKRESFARAAEIESLELEDQQSLKLDMAFLIGRLAFIPWIDSSHTLLEASREVDAAARLRRRGLSWYADGARYENNESIEDQLSPNAEIVFMYLRGKQPQMGKEISAATNIPLSTITRHVIPQLKQVCGLKNVAGKGYVLPRTS